MVSAFASQAALGQTAPVEGLDTIVVTAQKKEEDSQKVPIALSVLGGQELQKLGLDDITDLVGRIPSLNFSARDGMGIVTIRGIGLGITAAGADPGVAIHLDGIYSARPGGALSNFYDVERVEVARGPQGTLYGRNATGGAVNIISRMPTDDLSGYISGTSGNYSTVNVQGAISDKIGSDDLRFRIAFNHDSHSPYSDNYAGKGVNDLNTNAVKATLQYVPTANFSAVLRGDFFHENDAAYTPVLTGYVDCNGIPGIRTCGTAYGGTTAVGDPPNVGYDFNTINQRTYAGSSLTLDWDLGWAKARSISGWRYTKYYFMIDLDGSSYPIGSAGRREDGNQYSQEFQLSGKHASLTWLVGAFYFHESNDVHDLANFTIPDLATHLVVDQSSDIVTTAYAAFGQATLGIFDGLDATVGARYSSEKKSDVDDYVIQLPGQAIVPNPTRSKTFGSFTPKFLLEYHIEPAVMIYASAQKGFKSGGFTPGSPTDPFFKPETVWDYEGGIKATWFQNRLRANVAGFYYDYSNLQVSSVPPDGPIRTVITNAASARVKGVEAEITALPVPELRLEGNVSAVDAKYTSYKLAYDSLNPGLGYHDVSGNRLAQTPKFLATVAAEYTLQVHGGSVSVRGEFTHSAKVYFDVFEDPNNMGHAYNLENAFINYTTADGKWQVGIYGKNLSNEKYTTSSSYSTALLGEPVFENYGAPRTFGVKAARKF